MKQARAWRRRPRRAGDGQDTLNRLWLVTFARCQADAPPVGSVEVTTFPSLSTATQSEADGHDTAARPPGKVCVSPTVVVQAPVPPVGSVDVTTLPAEVATQSGAVGHDAADRAGATCAVVQAAGPPVGSVEVTTFPLNSTATHSETGAHDTPKSHSSGIRG